MNLDRRRFTVAEYERMIEGGVFHEDERVELIEGELIVVPPQGPEHAGEVSTLTEELVLAYGRGYAVRAQCPLGGDALSLPEPDLVVARGDPRTYFARHPIGSDVVLLIEIAKSSAAYDRRKAAVYAKMGVAEYWLVDLDQRRVEVRTGPMADGQYTVTRIVGEGEDLAPPGANDKKIAVTSLFPER